MTLPSPSSPPPSSSSHPHHGPTNIISTPCCHTHHHRQHHHTITINHYQTMFSQSPFASLTLCLLYTSDAADDTPCVDL
eukprot:5799566-Pyramimonas_sp.AAC.1